ncbi:SDR family oxidoreductase [Pectobacterium zantedeschiae]|uniref:SDR family oxidoreductase n=1 Tax=Pectobacterium zantedeschiae TaxID=2034769 RepID=UPI00101DC38A|nr:SDR family oxidoreductase [Pectobacterium zantedeschiae]RYC43113.1 oxidoreductase [Pectobacterium zantedeschiae]
MSGKLLENRVAIITGSTSGIGLAVAEELATHGVKLILNGRNSNLLNEVATRLNAVSVCGDMVSPETAELLLNAALTNYGRCDFVVNNAGIIETGCINDIDIEKVCRMVDVNVSAAYRLSYLAIRHFISQNYGYLINISSVMGTKVRATAGAYAGTKFAIEALSEALRMEVAGTSVGVTCIEPGLVMTNLHRDWSVHPSESMDISRPLDPADIARCVTFILTQPDHVRIPRLMILPCDHNI